MRSDSPCGILTPQCSIFWRRLRVTSAQGRVDASLLVQFRSGTSRFGRFLRATIETCSADSASLQPLPSCPSFCPGSTCRLPSRCMLLLHEARSGQARTLGQTFRRVKFLATNGKDGHYGAQKNRFGRDARIGALRCMVSGSVRRNRKPRHCGVLLDSKTSHVSIVAPSQAITPAPCVNCRFPGPPRTQKSRPLPGCHPGPVLRLTSL